VSAALIRSTSIFAAIAATNKNLEQLVEEGRFRPDLYYRLNAFQIQLPPLRERKGDIPVLVEHFVRKFSASMNKRIVRVSPGALALLDHYQWPGNIRELENSIERAMVVAQEPEIREEDFALRLPVAEHTRGNRTRAYPCRS
jgi:DNA-binding NtrC family response regulator